MSKDIIKKENESYENSIFNSLRNSVGKFSKFPSSKTENELDNNSTNGTEEEDSEGYGKKTEENGKKKLREFPLVVKALDDASRELLIDLNFLLFLTASSNSNKLKDSILEFAGFSFGSDCEDYNERKEFLQRMSGKLITDVARSFSLEIFSKRKQTILNILSFLMKPDESYLRINSSVPFILPDVELDDIEGSSDSDESITYEFVEQKVECIDLELPSEGSEYSSTASSGEEYDPFDLDKTVSDNSSLEDSLPSLGSSSVPHDKIWEKRDICIKREKFVEKAGPSKRILSMEDKSPLALFLEMFTMELIENIVHQTNLYAIQTEKTFTCLKKTEFLKFLAINLLMGIKRLHNYRDYWSTAPEINDPYISSQMSLKRFICILSNFQLNGSLMQPIKSRQAFKKLYMLQPFLSSLSEKFESVLLPHENQGIGKSMIKSKEKFKGRCTLQQNVPRKPIQHAYKVWMRCDESGFACQFYIYPGKRDELPEKNLAMRVVENLCSPLFGKSHKIFMDNSFTTYNLFRYLQTKQIYCSGTVNLTRNNLPKNLEEDKNLKRGDFDWSVSNDGITCIKWKDKKCVTVLSNQNNPTEVLQLSRKKADGSNLNINCPKAIVKYNRSIGFVDYFDQLRSIYETYPKTNKWWHRIFFYFLDATIVNAFILHKMLHNDTMMTLKDFRIEIISVLVRLGQSDTVQKRQLQSSKSSIQIKKHKPFVPKDKRLNAEHLAMRCTKRRCALCSTRAKPRTTKWKCSTCNVPLCLQRKDNNCYYIFHTQ